MERSCAVTTRSKRPVYDDLGAINGNDAPGKKAALDSCRRKAAQRSDRQRTQKGSTKMSRHGCDKSPQAAEETIQTMSMTAVGGEVLSAATANASRKVA
jgi:hypothetical protein